MPLAAENVTITPRGAEHPLITINRVSCDLSAEDRMRLRLLVKKLQAQFGYPAIQGLLNKSVAAVFSEYPTLVSREMVLEAIQQLNLAKGPRKYGISAFSHPPEASVDLSKGKFSNTYSDWYAGILSNLEIECHFDESAFRDIEALQEANGTYLPQSLSQFYSLSVDKINTCYNRLLPIELCSVNEQKIVFLEEYHFKMVWGVAQSSESLPDAAVWCGFDTANGLKWRKEHPSCRDFLSLMMIWNGTFGGGFPITAEGFVGEIEAARVLERDWTFIAEVNGIKAYHQRGAAVCFCHQEDLIQKVENLPSGRIYLAGASQLILEQVKGQFQGTWK